MLSPEARFVTFAPDTIFSHGTSGTVAVTAPLSPLPSFTTVTSMQRSWPTAMVVLMDAGVALK